MASPAIHMNFTMEGDISCSIHGSSSRYESLSNQHNIVYQPADELKFDISVKARVHQRFLIAMTEDFFCRLVQQDGGLMCRLQENICQGRMSLIGDNSLPITPQMHQVIASIISCNRTNSLGRLFLESRVLDLLLLQVEQFQQGARSKLPVFRLSSYDRDRLHAVKEWLSQDLARSPSLKELAKMARINEFKLKKGFREIFGTTVYGFLQDQRMIHAHHLLEDLKNRLLKWPWRWAISIPIISPRPSNGN